MSTIIAQVTSGATHGYYGAVFSTRPGGTSGSALDIFIEGNDIYYQVLGNNMGYNLISPTKVSNATWIHAIFTYSTSEGFHFPLFFWNSLHKKACKFI